MESDVTERKFIEERRELLLCFFNEISNVFASNWVNFNRFCIQIPHEQRIELEFSHFLVKDVIRYKPTLKSQELNI
jgi:hypothetical protein